MSHQHILAVGLRVIAWLIGLPSIFMFLDVGYSLLILNYRPAPGTPHFLDLRTYGLAGLLNNGAEVVGKVLEGVSVAASWIMGGVAILAFAAIVCAVCVYFIGKGIDNHAGWARVMAMLMAGGFLVVSLGLMTCLPRHLIPVPCVTTGLSLYALWVLGWKFC